MLNCIIICLRLISATDTPPPQQSGDAVSEEMEWTWLVITAGVLAVGASVCMSVYMVVQWRKGRHAGVDAAAAAAAAANEGYYNITYITEVIRCIHH